MQLIAEAYDLLHRGAGVPVAELADIFAEWNRGDLRSYLIEITARDLRETMDPDTGQPLVDVILDEAQQKGTGKWMSQNAFDVGAPIPTVNAAVEARLISALKTERVAASRVLPGSTRPVHRQPPRPHRADAPGAVREQDHVVRAGHGAAPRGVGRVPLRHSARRGREDLARRLHHPRALARRHPRRVSARAGPGQPDDRRGVQRRARPAPARLARTRSRRRSASAFRCRP